MKEFKFSLVLLMMSRGNIAMKEALVLSHPLSLFQLQLASSYVLFLQISVSSTCGFNTIHLSMLNTYR